MNNFEKSIVDTLGIRFKNSVSIGTDDNRVTVINQYTSLIFLVTKDNVLSLYTIPKDKLPSEMRDSGKFNYLKFDISEYQNYKTREFPLSKPEVTDDAKIEDVPKKRSKKAESVEEKE